MGDFYKFERDIEELWCKFIDGYLNPVFKKVYIYRNYGRIEFEKYLYTIFDPILKVNQQSNINNKDTFGRYINIDLVEYDDIYVISEVFSHFSNYDLYNNWPGKGNYLLFLLVKDSVLHIISKDYDSADYIIHIPDNWKKFVLYAVMQYFTSYVCNKRQQFKLFEESLYSFMRDNGTQYGD